MLGGLDGFRGVLTTAAGPGGGYRLTLRADPVLWNGLTLDPDTGELVYDGTTVLLAPAPAAVLAALIRAGGGLVTAADFAAATTWTAGTMDSAVSRLKEVLGRLDGFRGVITNVAGTGGYRLTLRAGPVSWNGLTLDPDAGELVYDGTTVLLAPAPAAVLAALIRACGGLVTGADFAAATTWTAGTMASSAGRLKEVLGRLDGFRGVITSVAGTGGGYRLTLRAGPAAVLAARGEVLVPVAGDGLCLANALLAVAAEPLARAGITAPEQVYENLAGYLESTEDLGPGRRDPG